MEQLLHSLGRILSLPESYSKSAMQEKPAKPRSRYRTVINMCAVIWYVTCGLLLVCSVGLGGFSLYCLIAHPVNADGQQIAPNMLRSGLYFAIASGLVDVAIVMFGRKYFRRAYARVADLEYLTARGPRRG